MTTEAQALEVERCIDRLTTIDQLPEVGPDLVQEASDCLDIILESTDKRYTTDEDRDARKFAVSVYKETCERAVTWNP